jgi:hypothetical protein
MNVPEIVDGLEEFDFHVSLDARQIPPAHDPADDIASIRIGKDDGLPNGQIVCGAKDGPVIEHDNGLALFPNRLSQAARFRWQTSNGDGKFQTDGVASRGLAYLVFRVLGRRARLARAIRVRGVFDRKRHGIPIMNGPHAHELAVPIGIRRFSIL